MDLKVKATTFPTNDNPRQDHQVTSGEKHHQSDGLENPFINELVKILASIKTMHTSFPKGTKFGYIAAIMTSKKY